MKIAIIHPDLSIGMADMILVNSNFTVSTLSNTFKRLHARGSRSAVLYPAVNIDQFNEPHAYKYIQNLSDVTLTVAGGYDEQLKENVDYLEELKSLAEKEGVSDQVNFITSCPTAERNQLLSTSLCVLYTPTKPNDRMNISV
ncbi:hypothetical protein Bca52824_025153 [Brassica carinata]|uniref:Uncharacterized protein n=1 Tax=Brassica carinata TaxID=52824 RepID=A0A8X7VLS0_BRACI|nr:hypothetical protein Bca52824_025153 [Brassica carinata]